MYLEHIFSNYQRAGIFGSVIILLVLVLRCLLQKAPRKYLCLMWLLVAIRLLIPFNLEHEVSLQPNLDRFQTTQIEMVTPQQETPLQPPVHTGQAEILPPEEPLTPAEPTKIDHAQLNMIIWLALVGALGLYFVLSYCHLRYKLWDAVLCEKDVWESDRIQNGFLLGYLKPRIYIPAMVSESDRQFIIAHERAHAARGDNWWKLCAFVCCCIHWYNPLVWVAYFLACRDIEIACDEYVISGMDSDQRKGYSMALLNCGKRSAGFFAYPVAFGKISLKQRIKNILNYRRAKPLVVVVTLFAVVFLAVFFLTSPVKGASEPPSQQEQTNIATTAPDMPTEETTQPTEEPTQPTEEPTQPTEEVTQPTVETTQPTEETTQPTEEPTQPTEETTQPTEEPTQPTEEPTQPATHQHNYGSGQVEVAATCSEEGIALYHCADCGAVKRESISKLSHILEDTTVTKEPNCTQPGEHTGTCSVCGAEPITQALPTNDVHIFTNTVTREATCTSAGEGMKVCTLCRYSEPCTYEPKPHTFGNDQILVKATCTTEGEKQTTCTDCGYGIKETIPKTDHIWTGASCTQAGICSVCNATGKKLAHTYQVFSDYTSPFENSSGIRVLLCDLCGHKKTIYHTSNYEFDLDAIGAEIAAYAKKQGFQVRLREVVEADYAYVESVSYLNRTGPTELIAGAKASLDEARSQYASTASGIGAYTADIYVQYIYDSSFDNGYFGVYMDIHKG